MPTDGILAGDQGYSLGVRRDSCARRDKSLQVRPTDGLGGRVH